MTPLAAKTASAKPWKDFAFENISIQLSEGEVTTLVGANGAGKSSLLRLLAGGLPLSHGSVELHQKPIGDWEKSARARTLSLLLQRQTLTFPFTVEEVVQLARLPHSTGAKVDRNVVTQCLQAFDMSAFRQRAYTDLSGGEQQRVQLARAFAQVWPQAQSSSSQAPVLLLDEPIAALDLAHLEMLQTRIREFSATGGAVGLVVHDLNFAIAVSDSLVFLREGRIVAQGAAKTVIEVPLFEQVFGITPLLGRHPDTGKPLVIMR